MSLGLNGNRQWPKAGPSCPTPRKPQTDPDTQGCKGESSGRGRKWFLSSGGVQAECGGAFRASRREDDLREGLRDGKPQEEDVSQRCEPGAAYWTGLSERAPGAVPFRKRGLVSLSKRGKLRKPSKLGGS